MNEIYETTLYRLWTARRAGQGSLREGTRGELHSNPAQSRLRPRESFPVRPREKEPKQSSAACLSRRPRVENQEAVATRTGRSEYCREERCRESKQVRKSAEGPLAPLRTYQRAETLLR